MSQGYHRVPIGLFVPWVTSPPQAWRQELGARGMRGSKPLKVRGPHCLSRFPRHSARGARHGGPVCL